MDGGDDGGVPSSGGRPVVRGPGAFTRIGASVISGQSLVKAGDWEGEGRAAHGAAEVQQVVPNVLGPLAASDTKPQPRAALLPSASGHAATPCRTIIWSPYRPHPRRSNPQKKKVFSPRFASADNPFLDPHFGRAVPARKKRVKRVAAALSAPREQVHLNRQTFTHTSEDDTSRGPARGSATRAREHARARRKEREHSRGIPAIISLK